ncbi:MAG: hypothetical protein JNK78_11505 [Planctomycetes bacterium]|nr:hypothetical protein [Planctomycetota bacterium]
MIPILRTTLLAAIALVGGRDLTAQFLQLADGKLLLGSIEGTPDGEGLRVKRLDNGGVLDLRWDHLSPASALAVKKTYDLAGDTHDEVMVRADEVEFLVNGTPQTIIGRVVDQSGDQILVQTKADTIRVPKGELRGRRTIDVPATQIYTKDAFYLMRKAEVQPGDSADKHILLAEELIKVRDYDHASEHLQTAKDLGNSRNAPHLDGMIQKLQRYKEAAKERELLDQIQAARSRGRQNDFEKGRTLMAQFEKDFPQSKLRADFETEKKRFEGARERFYTEQIADNFRRTIRIVADKKAADAATTLQSAREYAESKMTDDIVARLATQYRIEPAEVKSLWEGRERFAIGKRSEHFAYGLGSWILGEAALIKGTHVGKAGEKEKKEPVDENTARDIQRVARIFREQMDKRASAQQGANKGADHKLTEEEWWRQASREEKVGWLRAYYAEFGGQLKISFANVSPCVSCFGEGTTPEVTGDGKMVRTECFLCQGTKWLRTFKAY